MKRNPITMGVGVALGAGIGTAIGAAVGQVGPWIAIGVGVGVAIACSCAPLSTKDQAKNPSPKG